MNNISENELKELARIKKNEYQRSWNSKNKDKVKQYKEDYWKREVLKDMVVKEIQYK